MQQWPHEVKFHSRKEIQECCEGQFEWQAFRSRLKGLPTTEKLVQLDKWLYVVGRRYYLDDVVRTQVDNYINALKRGGQLSMELRVVR